MAAGRTRHVSQLSTEYKQRLCVPGAASHAVAEGSEARQGAGMDAEFTLAAHPSSRTGCATGPRRIILE